MTLDEFDDTLDFLQKAYDMNHDIRFWLIDTLYKRFLELNGLTAYQARLKKVREGERVKLEG